MDPETRAPHVHNHDVDEDEVSEVLANPGEDRAGREGSRIAVGRTNGGSYLRVIDAAGRFGTLPRLYAGAQRGVVRRTLAMRGTLKFLCLASAAVTLVACTTHSSLMDYPQRKGFDVQAPPPGEVSVIFMRPATGGGIVSAVVFDGTELIGILMDESYIVYETTPGPHRFMILSEAADFMDADLEPGKLYCALVKPRWGWWRARYSLLPVRPTGSAWPEVPGFLANSRRSTVNDAGRAWAQENAASILEKRDAYLPRWLEKSVTARPTLRPSDGVQLDALR